MTDPPDHPGYKMVNLFDDASREAAEAAGYRLAQDAQKNVIGPVYTDSNGVLTLWAVMSRGYK